MVVRAGGIARLVMQEGGGFNGLLDRIEALQVDPYSAAQGISRRLRTLIKDL